MWRLELFEGIIVALGTGLGLMWAFCALALFFTFNVSPAADLLGVLRGVLLWPVEVTFIVGPLLDKVGFYRSTDILLLTVMVAGAIGFIGGVLIVYANRRYSWL